MGPALPGPPRLPRDPKPGHKRGDAEQPQRTSKRRSTLARSSSVEKSPSTKTPPTRPPAQTNTTQHKRDRDYDHTPHASDQMGSGTNQLAPTTQGPDPPPQRPRTDSLAAMTPVTYPVAHQRTHISPDHSPTGLNQLSSDLTQPPQRALAKGPSNVRSTSSPHCPSRETPPPPTRPRHTELTRAIPHTPPPAMESHAQTHTSLPATEPCVPTYVLADQLSPPSSPLPLLTESIPPRALPPRKPG